MSCLLPVVLAACLSPTGPAFSGRLGQLDVAPPRLAVTTTVDGRLDEPAWGQAARLTGFSRYLPTDGIPADDSTEVLVWYTATALHVGVRAFAAAGAVRATLADRDRIFMDDHVSLFLGTFDDGRQATVVSVNPLGSQADGILVETGASATASFLGGLAVGREAVDVAPNIVFQSKGRVTAAGYEVELRIPFKSLSFQPGGVQRWGFNVTRVVQSRGFEYSWAPAARGQASFLGQSGHLTGLTGLERGLVLDATPIVTSRTTGAATSAGAWGYEPQRPQLGANVRWGITPNLTLNGTVRPDFAEVEADAGQFVYDPRSALYFPERRPFFLDGIEQFSTPSNLVYTRRVVAPLAAAKLTGKVGGTGIAWLGAVDDVLGSATGTGRPLVNVLRLQRDLGGQSRAGVLLASTEEPRASNRVAGADARFVLTPITSLQLQGAVSRTTTPGAPTRVGPLWNASLNVSTARFGLRYLFSGVSDAFATRTGFIARPAIVRARAQHRLTALGSAQALFQKTDGDVILDGTWRYGDFVSGRQAIEQKLHLTLNTQLRGGWAAGLSTLIERFRYDDRLYADYAIERRTGTGRDTVPFTGIPAMGNLDWGFTFATPQFARWSADVFWLFGRDQNFFEWAPSDVAFLSVTAKWRPTDQLRTEFTWNLQQYDRPQDGTRAGRGRIPRLRVEYQLSRSVFFRFVGQYVAQERDSLRNVAGGNEPILIRDPGTGAYAYARAQASNGLRADWLFSYLPVPGTVIFAGYGSSLTEDRAFTLTDLRRAQDGFFLKASWLFRL